MDLDIEMDDACEARLNIPAIEHSPSNDILILDDGGEPGEIVEDGLQNDDTRRCKAVIPTKIHIRGLDSLHTDDLKTYVKLHFGVVDRVEWIDETSANLVFASELTARAAVAALSSIEVSDSSALAICEILPEKHYYKKPQVSLQVRFALESDRKQAGAALRSRYYLFHPENDPEERQREHQLYRFRDRGRDCGQSRADRGRRDLGYGGVETFEASMYDDKVYPSRPRSHSDFKGRATYHGRGNGGKELFKNQVIGRDRSASPLREDDVPMTHLTSPLQKRKIGTGPLKDRVSIGNGAKELFPNRTSGRSGQLCRLEQSMGSASPREKDLADLNNSSEIPTSSGFKIRGLSSQFRDGDPGFTIKGTAAKAKELFSNKLCNGNAGKELLDTGRTTQAKKPRSILVRGRVMAK